MFHLVSKFLLVSICFATVATVAAEPSGLSVRALLLVRSGPVINLHPLSGEKVGAAVLVGAGGLSDPFEPSTRKFSLAVPDAKQETGFRAVAKVVLPELGKDFIVLLEPTGATCKAYVINGRESRFGADCILFFNATKVKLGAKLGKNKVIIKPRVAVFGKAPARVKKPYYQVTFYQPDNNKARPFANTRWPHRKSGRCYIFFYRNATGRIIYQAVDEEIKPVATTE